MPSLMPCAPQFSFYELRVAEQQIINPLFFNIGGGYWEYRKDNLIAEIRLPCWDPLYDWESAYADARRRLRMPWWF